MNYLIPFLILITVVVFIHEYGHYYFAKKYGVGVTDFSIGFGREIFGWNDKSGTRWKICWIPLGGYVKFFGDRNVFSQSEQQELIDSLVEYMTFINYLINEECYNLGISMGLSKELLKEVIFWSVGTCWIADNFENYSPDNNILKKIQNIKTNLKLRTTERIIS